jgi:2'-5' RNA ligase
MRLFVALPVAAAVAAALDALARRLRRALPPDAVRWTPPDQRHLTLLFLGEVAPDRLTALEQTLRAACGEQPAVDLVAAGIGCFPDVERPRVIWAGVREDAGRLRGLQSRIAAALASFVQRPEERAFHPHLTLGRVNDLPPRDRRALSECLAREQAGELGRWRASAVLLMRSDLAPMGALHTELASIPLAET